MKATSNPITNKTALHLNRLIFGVQLMLSVTAMLILIVQPCGAIKSGSSAHSHKYKLKSVNCCSGVRTMVCSCGKTKKHRGKKGHEYHKVKDGLYTIKQCKVCGRISEKYLSDDIPEYWNKSIASALKTAKTRGTLPGYIYMTDPHWAKNAKNSPAIVSYATKQMGYSYAVCGGDIVTGFYDNKVVAVKEIKEFYGRFTVPVLTIVGNHDDNSNGNSNKSSHLNESDIHRLMLSRSPPKTHFSHDGNFAYLDDSKHHVRYISFYFDESTPVSADVIDSINRRVSELDDRWSVVLYSHAYWHYAHPGETLAPTQRGKRLADALLDIQRRSRATIVLWHVGHIHRDKSEVLSDGNGNQILVVSTNCDAYKKSACWGGLAMSKGTDSEQIIEIVQIDRDARKIYMTRIGAGRSRTFDILTET